MLILFPSHHSIHRPYSPCSMDSLPELPPVGGLIHPRATGLFHLAQYLRGTLTLQNVSEFLSCLGMSNIPLYGFTVLCLSTQVTDIWGLSTLGLLGILLNALECTHISSRFLFSFLGLPPACGFAGSHSTSCAVALCSYSPASSAEQGNGPSISVSSPAFVVFCVRASRILGWWSAFIS